MPAGAQRLLHSSLYAWGAGVGWPRAKKATLIRNPHAPSPLSPIQRNGCQGAKRGRGGSFLLTQAPPGRQFLLHHKAGPVQGREGGGAGLFRGR